MRLRVRNGRIVDPAQGIDELGDLLIVDGKVSAIGVVDQEIAVDQEVDASNQVVCPGLVDLCARFGDLGVVDKGVVSETTAAAAGGVSSICVPPDTVPVVDSTQVVELILQQGVSSQQAKVFPIGALTQGLQGVALSEIATLQAAGCIGFSNAMMPIVDSQLLRRALEYAKTHDVSVHLYCMDSFLQNDGVVHEGAVGVRLGLPMVAEMAETVAISRVLLLNEKIACRVHFCRLSAARSIALVQQAKEQGMPVSADVGIAHLFLTEHDVSSFNSDCFVLPPLRSMQDKEQLGRGLVSGAINCICSDHQPHGADVKSVPFSMAEPGASTIEMLLPLTLRLMKEYDMTLSQVLALVTCVPAGIAGIAAGDLAVGSAADVCVFDPNGLWMIEKNALCSLGKNTPFMGWEMQGKVSCTIIDGQIVYQCGQSDGSS